MGVRLTESWFYKLHEKNDPVYLTNKLSAKDRGKGERKYRVKELWYAILRNHGFLHGFLKPSEGYTALIESFPDSRTHCS